MKHNIVLLFSFTLLIGFFAKCNSSLPSESIVGGDDAKLGQFKYQVSVVVKYRNMCGGGILDDTHVITAAHCLIHADGTLRLKELQVIAGFVDFSDTNAVRVPVDKIYFHKNFHNESSLELHKSNGDIAVLKLKHNLGLGKNANLDKLALPNREFIYIHKTAVVAGFGKSFFMKIWSSMKIPMTFSDSNGKLHYLNTTVQTNIECGVTYGDTVHNSNMCAKAFQRMGHAGTCIGDSGSPLVLNNVVIGLVMATPECNEEDFPSIYTRVPYYISFVKNALKDKRTSMMRVAVYDNKIDTWAFV